MRPHTRDDRAAAARGLKMLSMSVRELSALIERHQGIPLFASQTIAAAAKEIRAVKVHNCARHD